MPRRIDLSGRLESGLWDYRVQPGLAERLPPITVEPALTLERDGAFSSRLSLTTLSGTYLETGAHLFPDAPTLDALPLERFFLPAALIRLPTQHPGALIRADLLAAHAPPLQPGDAVLIDSGWGPRWNQPGYVQECPRLRMDAMTWLLERGIALLGLDLPVAQGSATQDPDTPRRALLGALFRAGALLLAPCVNLPQIKVPRGELICLPLPLKGTSGAPVRAVYVEA